MSHAPAVSIALGVGLFWAALVLYGAFLWARARRTHAGAEDGKG